MTARRVLLLMALIVLIQPSLLAQNIRDKTTDSAISIISKNDAVDMAIRYTGFSEIPAFSKGNVASAKCARFDDINIPFLHDSTINKDIWEVQLSGIIFPFEPDVAGEDKPSWTFRVLIDAKEGSLIKIEAKSSRENPDIAPEPPVEKAERQLRLGGEIYHNFLKEPAKLSLFDIFSKGSGGIVAAEEMTAVLVEYSEIMLPDTLSAWIITFKGLSRMELSRPVDHLPDYMLNYIRSVFDADTGKLIYVTTRPTVEKWDGKK